MSEPLLLLLSLSLSGSLAGLGLLALGRMGRRLLSHTWRYYLWLMVLACLLLPAPLSQWPAPPPEALPPLEIARHAGDRESIPRELTEPAPPLEPPAERTALPGLPKARKAVPYAMLVWGTVAVTTLGGKALGYFRFVRFAQRRAGPVEDGAVLAVYQSAVHSVGMRRPPPIYTSRIVGSPMAVGLLRPRILLPETGLDERDLRYIFIHELLHCKRRDGLYKWLVQLALCVHWFNPLLYLFARQMDRDCELACDEGVLARVGGEARRPYGDMLLATLRLGLRYPGRVVTLPLNEDGRLLKARLAALKSWGPFTGKRAASSLGLGILAAFCCLLAGVVPVWAMGNEGDVLVLDVQGCNVLVLDTGGAGATFYYDELAYSVEHANQGNISTLTVRELAGLGRGVTDEVRLSLPMDSFSRVIVRGDSCSVYLPPLYGSIEAKMEKSVLGYTLPKGYARSVSVTAMGGGIGARLHRELTGYTFTIDGDNTLLDLPQGIGTRHSDGNGRVIIQQEMIGGAFELTWYDDGRLLADEDVYRAIPLFDLESGEDNRIDHPGGMLRTYNGNRLSLLVESTASGGPVSISLTDPLGNEQVIPLEKGVYAKEIPLFPGTWSYLCAGSFESGEVRIQGQLIE